MPDFHFFVMIWLPVGWLLVVSCLVFSLILLVGYWCLLVILVLVVLLICLILRVAVFCGLLCVVIVSGAVACCALLGFLVQLLSGVCFVLCWLWVLFALSVSGFSATWVLVCCYLFVWVVCLGV